MKTEPQSEKGSDHTVVGSYSQLYEEGEVEHINGLSHPSEWKYIYARGGRCRSVAMQV